MIPRNGIEEPRKPIHVHVCVCMYVCMLVAGTGWWRDTEKRRETRTRRENLDILEAMALFGASRATLSRSNPPPPFPRPTNLPPYTTLRLPFSLVESNYTRQDPPAREGDTVKLLRGTERRGSVVPLPLSSPRAVQEGQADSRRG